ncbi:MAG TPA: hypothetical protein VLX92_05955 [Kofleriaceae bacterium]|nr:hypothetical protein [Kofleriaceae bacterium]
MAIWLQFGCGGTSDPPLTDATSLTCPTPGNLPFRLETHGYRNSADATLVKTDTTIKDEAGDVLGNPGGALASVYLDDSASPATGIDYHGEKARTTATDGLVSHPLTGEYVDLYYYDPGAMEWQQLARGQTDVDGAYDFPTTGLVAPNAQPVYAMLEADGSCAVHYDYTMPSGSKFVVFDIDGTLTTSDNELIMQLEDETYVPMQMTAANLMVQEWAKKGYPVVYLTARLHAFDAETRAWLDMLDFPKGPIITENGGEAADVYKTLWLQRMVTDFGWVPYAAYGNATTDITAYANVNIPLDHTFIIGPEGGMGGTVAIPNMDYTQHITQFIDMQPDNN